MHPYEYVSYVNALEICDLDLLSAGREAHCLRFSCSLLKSELTKMLIPPSRQEIHGKQLRNSTNITQLLTDSLKAPYPSCLIPPSLPSWWLLHCPPLVWLWIFFSVCLCFFFFFLLLIYCIFCVCLYDAIWPLGCDVMLIHIISYHIISYHIISYHIISYHINQSINEIYIAP